MHGILASASEQQPKGWFQGLLLSCVDPPSGPQTIRGKEGRVLLFQLYSD